LTRPNGITDAISFDAAGNLISLNSTIGATVVSEANYTYNSAGLRNTFTTTTGTTAYTYDPADQLISAAYPASTGLPSDNFTYDAVGNRTSATGSPLGSFTYDSGNRLQSDAANTYTYDNEGNLLSRVSKSGGATTSYTWTAEHQLTGIVYPDGTIATFRYDPLGRRVEIDEGTSTARYAFDGSNLAAEYDGTNTLTATYIEDPTITNGALEMVRGGERYFYLPDAQHSVIAVTTLAGATAATYTYTAFGLPTQTGSLTNPITYTGALYDSRAGLFLLPFRAYDPAAGRFLSEDPVPPVDPYSTYAYVLNDPANLIDPTGAVLVEDAELRKNTTEDEEFIAGRLKRYCGISRQLFGTRVHDIKAALGLGPAVNLLFGRNGDVFSPSGEFIQNLTEGGGDVPGIGGGCVPDP
jgi:RHS repeat-associated protein